MKVEIKPQQLDFLDWELGVFFHFGIRTFYEGHKDWDNIPMDPKKFNPTSLDCNQWIRTIKEAGAKYAILVTKHHDGFALWPTQYSNYSVSASPWKNGKGDVVQEYVDACRAYGIKVGLYYSPAEFGYQEKSSQEYDDYFIDQISELLTNYGKIDYLWFDGCGSENHQYDTVRIIREIRRLQPEILIFNMWDPDTRWVGNESGVAHLENNNLVNSLDFSVQTDVKDILDDERFLPVECDCRIRLSNWFYSDSDAHTLKSIEELMGLYYYSVGRGANLLINIAPDREGKLPQKDAETFLAFGQEIKRRFSCPLKTEQIVHQDNRYLISFPQDTLVNHVVLKEDISQSEQVKQFQIKAYPFAYGDPIVVYEGHTIGHKVICQFSTIRTQKIELVIQKSSAPETIKSIELFYIS